VSQPHECPDCGEPCHCIVGDADPDADACEHDCGDWEEDDEEEDDDGSGFFDADGYDDDDEDDD
jgi:hypothetical protein